MSRRDTPPVRLLSSVSLWHTPGQDPVRLRKKFGRSLRLWGGVDKRELAKDRKAIDEHLCSFIPLIEEGGFIPAVDHTVPPDVPLKNFMYYMLRKKHLLEGRFEHHDRNRCPCFSTSV